MPFEFVGVVGMFVGVSGLAADGCDDWIDHRGWHSSHESPDSPNPPRCGWRGLMLVLEAPKAWVVVGILRGFALGSERLKIAVSEGGWGRNWEDERQRFPGTVGGGICWETCGIQGYFLQSEEEHPSVASFLFGEYHKKQQLAVQLHDNNLLQRNCFGVLNLMESDAHATLCNKFPIVEGTSICRNFAVAVSVVRIDSEITHKSPK